MIGVTLNTYQKERFTHKLVKSWSQIERGLRFLSLRKERLGEVLAMLKTNVFNLDVVYVRIYRQLKTLVIRNQMKNWRCL